MLALSLSLSQDYQASISIVCIRVRVRVRVRMRMERRQKVERQGPGPCLLCCDVLCVRCCVALCCAGLRCDRSHSGSARRTDAPLCRMADDPRNLIGLLFRAWCHLYSPFRLLPAVSYPLSNARCFGRRWVTRRAWLGTARSFELTVGGLCVAKGHRPKDGHRIHT